MVTSLLPLNYQTTVMPRTMVKVVGTSSNHRPAGAGIPIEVPAIPPILVQPVEHPADGGRVISDGHGLRLPRLGLSNDWRSEVDQAFDRLLSGVGDDREQVKTAGIAGQAVRRDSDQLSKNRLSSGHVHRSSYQNTASCELLVVQIVISTLRRNIIAFAISIVYHRNVGEE
jgi:hypothetical protein